MEAAEGEESGGFDKAAALKVHLPTFLPTLYLCLTTLEIQWIENTVMHRMLRSILASTFRSCDQRFSLCDAEKHERGVSVCVGEAHREF